MAEKVWVVHLESWSMQLMWPVDAREAVRPDARPAKEAA